MIAIEKNNLDAIVAAAKCGNGVARTLDPGVCGDASAIRAFLSLSGKTPATHPALFADVDAARTASEDAGAQVLHIVDQGRDANGNATARVWHLDTAGGHMAGSVVLALDADSDAPVALGYANRVGGGLCPAATRSATAAPAPARMTTVGFYHSQSTPDSVPSFGIVSATAALGDGGYTWTIDDPIGKLQPAAVQIGLGRGTNTPSIDVDYAYTNDVDGTTTPPVILVPFSGTVDLGQPLDPSKLDGTGHFTSGLQCTSQIYSTATTGFYSSLTNGRPALTTVPTGKGNIVSWSYPFDNAKAPTSSQSLAYNNTDSTGKVIVSANPTPSMCAFRFDFTVPVQDPAVGTVLATVCSNDWPDMPSTTCKVIQPIQFWFHCIAFGTDVTLADGSTRAIEAIGNDVRVKTGHGGTLGVEATTRGPHSAIDPGHAVTGVFELTTEGGRTLILTGGHPVATQDGLLRASDLTPGSIVLTDTGTDSVSSITPVDYTGSFANLKLIDAGDRAKGLAGTVGTFIAGGIVVGDHASMEQTHYRNAHSMEYMKARLHERYHTDYASTLQTIAQDNIRYGGSY